MNYNNNEKDINYIKKKKNNVKEERKIKLQKIMDSYKNTNNNQVYIKNL